LQFTTLFVRAVRVRRFETLSRQDLAQFLIVGAICGMIWWQVGGTGGWGCWGCTGQAVGLAACLPGYLAAY